MVEEHYLYLREIGLNDSQIHIYDYLLRNKSGTINNIKDELNYSYAQVSNNLSKLEELGLIFSSKGMKNRKFFRMDPKIALTNVLQERVKNFEDQIDKIDEKIKIEESVRGVCVKNISFYNYSDMNLAVQNFFSLIEQASKEIIISALPPNLMKQLEPAFYNAFLRGVQIYMYFSNRDFEEITNYFEISTDIFKRVGISITQTIEKTCQVARYNDIVVNIGLVLIDGTLFNAINFIDDDVFHFDGFYGPGVVQQSRSFLRVKSIEKKIKIEYPTLFETVLNVIKKNKSISTRDLSIECKVSGSRLREILDYFLNKGFVKENETKGEIGKPRKQYTFIE
jgi:sugar-specific transcriptional regulator TrmB